MIVSYRVSWRMSALTAGLLLAVWVSDTRPDPPTAAESLRAGTEPANDRAIRWTFDTGG